VLTDSKTSAFGSKTPAELARKNELPAAELEAGVRAVFAAWERRLVSHLEKCLGTSPTVVVEAPPDA
jgi:hypothetical protein